MRLPQPYTAAITGTGAAININCGFEPKLVIVANLTTLALTVWSSSMDQAKGIQIADAGADAANVFALGSAGISSSSQGFSLGTNALLNANSDDIHVIAF